jgi:drug/metabolite transporter (DMT)-like permease
VDITTAVLMLAAGLLHASWHAIVKTGSGLSTLAGMGIVSAALTLPLLFFLDVPPLSVWPVLAVSLALHSGYKASLARAYQQGDLSKAYPLARGIVPLFAASLSYVLLQQAPSAGQFIGIVIVSAGVLALATERVGASIDGRLVIAALGASLMVAGYSVVDGYGTRITDWASFTAWLIVLDSTLFLGIARLLRGPRLWPQMARNKGSNLAAGILGLCSFTVFVWALSRNPVAIIVAFRECSVIFATIIGASILRERISPRRLSAIGAVAGGLFLIATLR